MWGIITVICVFVFAMYLILGGKSKAISPPTLESTPNSKSLPIRILHPAKYTDQPGIVAFEFVAENLPTACNFARSHNGLRKQARDCAGLPLNDCHSQNCGCYYKAIAEQRREHRRSEHDRRTALRFDDHDDRRQQNDRRKDGQLNWQEKLLK